MPRLIDLTGQRFGKLIPIEYTGSDSKWLCRCDCGGQITTRAKSLKASQTMSCGCLKKGKPPIIGMRTEDKKTSREYNSWARMLSSCNNSNDLGWKLYGGRGIKVCSRWLKSFPNFLSDMGKRPEGMSIDRINVNGHYSCGCCEECDRNGWTANCRWASPKQQARNRRNNKLLTFNGETKTQAEWCEELGISVKVVHYRIKHGWSIEEALKTPVSLGNKIKIIRAMTK